MSTPMFFQALKRLAVTAVVLIVIAASQTASANGINPELANCDELKDPITLDQATVCSAHVGCRFVLRIHRTCAQAKKFLGQLSTAAEGFADGLRSLFSSGNRQPQQAGMALFSASLNNSTRRIDRLEETKKVRQVLEQGLSDPKRLTTLEGPRPTGSSEPAWIYYGQVAAEKSERSGWGVEIRSDGTITKALFFPKITGYADVILKNGNRITGEVGIEVKPDTFETIYRIEAGARATSDGLMFVGSFDERDRIVGRGWGESGNGTRFVGTFKDGLPEIGKAFRPDGTLLEEGEFSKGFLVRGKRFSADGKTVVAELDPERDRQRAFAQQLESMNPGQLFALQDQLASAGNVNGAKDALRALLQRFPDHALAAVAAQRLSALGSSPSSGGGAATEPRRASTGSRGAPAGSCKEAYAAKDQELAPINQRPLPPGGPPPHQRVMWMLEQLMDTVKARCSGAERDQLMAELERMFRESEKACNAMATQRCTPNAY